MRREAAATAPTSNTTPPPSPLLPLAGFPALAIPYSFYGRFCGVLLLTHFVGYALAVAVAAAAPSQPVALAIFPVLFLFMAMFSGESISSSAVAVAQGEERKAEGAHRRLWRASSGGVCVFVATRVRS